MFIILPVRGCGREGGFGRTHLFLTGLQILSGFTTNKGQEDVGIKNEYCVGRDENVSYGLFLYAVKPAKAGTHDKFLSGCAMT